MYPVRRSLGLVAALMLAGSTTCALAADDAAPAKRHRPPSLEGAIMRNAVLEALSQKTGQSVTALSELMDTSDPRTTPIYESLKLDRATMREVHEQARKSVVAKALQSGMITPDQATELDADWVPRVGPHLNGRQDRPDLPERPNRSDRPMRNQ